MLRREMKTFRTGLDELLDRGNGTQTPEIVLVADDSVSADVTRRLQVAAEHLEAENLKLHNWIPGKENIVLNLIDPSLHCLLYKKTKVLDAAYLPRDVPNNYTSLLHFSTSMIPSKVLGHPGDIYYDEEQFVNFGDKFQWLPAEVNLSPDGAAKFTSYVNGLHPGDHAEMYSALEDVLTSFIPMLAKIPFKHSSRGEVCKGGEIKVIVRMASTLLTPENPRHPGGDWHCEGFDEEAITAVGIYYYSIDNVTPSQLNVMEDGTDIFRRDEKIVTIETIQGRSIAFSNSHTHRLSPFELSDPTRPGHRKMVAFFLVQPGYEVISTAVVPCQQREWFVAEVKEILARFMPHVVVDHIVKFVGEDYMDLEQAKVLRDQMHMVRRDPPFRREILHGAVD